MLHEINKKKEKKGCSTTEEKVYRFFFVGN